MESTGEPMIVSNKEKYSASSIYTIRQVLLSLTGLFNGLCAGGIFGFSSIVFQQMRINNTLNINSDQESWIAAIVTTIMFPATVFCIWGLDKFGRKSLAAICELSNIIGCVIIFSASSYEILLLGRFASGIYVGIAYPTYVTYLAEISSPKQRALMLSLIQVGATLGILLMQALGHYIKWNYVALIFAIFPLFNLSIILNAKESYIFYINKNNLREARKSFVWFKGESEESNEEYCKATAKITSKQLYNFKEFVKMCHQRSFFLPFVISNLLYLTNQLSGVLAFSFYSSSIIAAISTDVNLQYFALLVLNIMRFLGVILSTLLVKKFSVRAVLLVSSYALGFSILCLSLFSYLRTYDNDNKLYPILCLVLLVCNVIFFSVGLDPLPTIICGELYPAAFRGIGCSISAGFSFLILFFVVKLMPMMLENLGSSISFLLFGIFTIGGITITWFILPNTKNKTLKEIEDIFSNK